jgi:prepilin-type N-terminal cleavage/methylation domain-containing protein
VNPCGLISGGKLILDAALAARQCHPTVPRRRVGLKRRGLSLMEVVLALAILGVALAMIGELIRIGSRAGEAARDDMEKQLIAESLINEIASSAVYPEPVFEQPVDDLGEWLYTVETEPVDEVGLIAVRVTIRKADAAPTTLPPYSLTRWMLDPEVEASAREAQLVMEEQLKLRAQAQASGTETDNSAASSSQGTNATGGQQTPAGQNPMSPGTNGLPPGFDPSQLPPGFDPKNFDPSKLPPGFDPSKLPPGLIPGGRGNRGGGNNGGPRGPGGNNGPGNNGPGGRGVRGGGAGGRGNGS